MFSKLKNRGNGHFVVISLKIYFSAKFQKVINVYRTRGKNLGRFGVQMPRGCMFLVFGSVAPAHCAHRADSMHYTGNCSSLDSSNAPDLPSGAPCDPQN